VVNNPVIKTGIHSGVYTLSIMQKPCFELYVCLFHYSQNG